MTEHTECIGEIYRKICAGDPLTDAELEFGIEGFKGLAERLLLLGTKFNLAWNEVRRCQTSLETFKYHRNN